jgi:NTP pyrophosphatase (non-canonical NTP hydrolase)
VDIAAVQRAAWQNKLDKGFNITDVALEFGLLTAEVGEAFTAWRKRLPDLGEELADVLIYLTAVAEMTGVDLSAEVARKLAINAERVYRQDGDGVLRRVSDQPSRSPERR